MTISEDSVANVVSPSSAEALADLLSTAASTLDSALEAAQTQWSRLFEVFEVSGTEGLSYMLDPAARSVQEWGVALASARRALIDAATTSLPGLVTRREALLSRIVEVNRSSAEAASAVEGADSAYWSAYESDAQSSSTATARTNRMDALHEQEVASESVAALKADIEKFRRDVEQEESALAGRLKGIGGGDEVRGAWDEEVRVSQTFWGFSEQAYPGGPRTDTDLTGNFEDAMSETAIARLNWLSMVDAETAEEWVDGHPGFGATIGFIDPAVASKLWDGLASESTRGPSDHGGEQWVTGPLAQLFTVAPFAIGSMNGLQAKDRDEFNRETLRQVLADPDAPKEQREAAEQTQKALTEAASRSPAGTTVQLIALELPTDGGERDMRAAISVGNLDTAQDVGVMIPGMNSSVSSSIAGLAQNAVNMQDAGRRIGNLDMTATVVWMGYESPTEMPSDGSVYVAEETLAQTGALSLGRFMNGVDFSNAAAETTIHAHSYATRMVSYALAGGEYGGAKVDHFVMYGSPGIAESVRTVDDLPGVPPGEVYSTKSAGDQYVSPFITLGNMLKSTTTEDEGWVGVAEMGELESDATGIDNVDPNDDGFWADGERNVFDSEGVAGHSTDKSEKSDGYWSRGSDPLRDGALITAGRGDEVE